MHSGSCNAHLRLKMAELREHIGAPRQKIVPRQVHSMQKKRRQKYHLSLNRCKRKRSHAERHLQDSRFDVVTPQSTKRMRLDSTIMPSTDSTLEHRQAQCDTTPIHPSSSSTPASYGRCASILPYAENTTTPTNMLPPTDTVTAAPVKQKGRNRKRIIRTKLFSKTKKASGLNSYYKRIIEILHDVCMELYANDMLHDFTSLLSLINNKAFPMDNIAFKLLLEVARWYSLSNTTQMYYSKDTLLFWRVLYKLFHGGILRFMSGDRSNGESGECEAGLLSPLDSHINFAVPSVQTIREFEGVTCLPNELKPGIIQHSLDIKRNTTKSHVLSVDGKKIASGLNSSWGDINLFGHESTNLDQMRVKLDKENAVLVKLEKLLATNPLSKETEKKVLAIILDLVKNISIHIKELRQTALNQTFGLKKFQVQAGSDWRNSKYVFAISSIHATLHQVKECIQKLLQSNLSLANIASNIQSSQTTLCPEPTLDMSYQANYVQLKETPEGGTVDPRFVKQRTNLWHGLRNRFSVTGSTLFAAIGLDTLIKQQKHMSKYGTLYASLTLDTPDVQFKDAGEQTTGDAEQQKYMKYGTDNEVNALATLVGRAMPLFFPKCTYYEEGVHIINNTQHNPQILVSPDGSISRGMPDLSDAFIPPKPLLGVELKCPYPKDVKLPVHYEMPQRYVTQVLAEMASMSVSHLIYLCWSQESSTVFLVSFSEMLWNQILEEVERLYGSNKPPLKPTRLSEASKLLKPQVQDFVRSHVNFLGELPSVKATNSGIVQVKPPSPYAYPMSKDFPQRPQDTGEVISNIKCALNECFQLGRKKASEVLVWLVSDVDRAWHGEIPHALPVAYALKGYSLTVKTMRDMNEQVMQACYENGIHIADCSFDGQWLNLANRSAENKPLTLLQLRKDVWEEVRGTPKENLVATLSDTALPVITKANGNSVIVQSKLMSTFYAVLSRGAINAEQVTDGVIQSDQSESSACVDQLPEEAIDILQQESIITEQDTQIFCGEELDEPSVSGLTDTIRAITTGELHDIMLELQSSSHATTVKKWKEKTVSDLKETITNLDSTQKLTVKELDIILSVAEKCRQRLLQSLLTNLKEHNDTKLKHKWKDMGIKHLVECIIDKTKPLSPKETEVVEPCLTWLRKRSQVLVKKSWPKMDKVNATSMIFGDGTAIERQTILPEMLSLKEQCAKAILKPKSRYARPLPKSLLNTIAASIIYCEKRRHWEEASTIKSPMKIDGIEEQITWFSYPELSAGRGQLEPKCLDGDHLLVNLRVKVCKDGLPGFGVSKDAWSQVAEQGIISRALVFDLIDKQNNSYAKKTFSSEVEQAMVENGHMTEAQFCKLVREWYAAEDEPAIGAIERLRMRLRFRSFLMNGVDLSSFPPPCGGYINGMPQTMYEGFLQSIDTHIQLYAVCRGGTYNQRAISSLVNETFFGELGELEPTKLGCPKAVSIPRLMSSVTEIMHYRNNPHNRSFSMRTSKSAVYPNHKLDSAACDVPDAETTEIFEPVRFIDSIHIRDHYFDKQERRRRKPRKSKPSDVSKPNETARGTRPIRQHHKRDESKILPTTRLGLDIDKLN